MKKKELKETVARLSKANVQAVIELTNSKRIYTAELSLYASMAADNRAEIKTLKEENESLENELIEAIEAVNSNAREGLDLADKNIVLEKENKELKELISANTIKSVKRMRKLTSIFGEGESKTVESVGFVKNNPEPPEFKSWLDGIAIKDEVYESQCVKCLDRDSCKTRGCTMAFENSDK